MVGWVGVAKRGEVTPNRAGLESGDVTVKKETLEGRVGAIKNTSEGRYHQTG